MVGFEQTDAPASGLTWRTFGIAFAVHAALFLFFWAMGVITFRKPDVIIPIDMTIVPPLLIELVNLNLQTLNSKL